MSSTIRPMLGMWPAVEVRGESISACIYQLADRIRCPMHLLKSNPICRLLLGFPMCLFGARYLATIEPSYGRSAIEC